jgi:hypothetical protein
MEQVRSWLTEHGLGSYADSFSELGYDDLGLLPELDEAELEELVALTEMKRGHAVKMKKRLAEICGGSSGNDGGETNELVIQEELATKLVAKLSAKLSVTLDRHEERIHALEEVLSVSAAAAPAPMRRAGMAASTDSAAKPRAAAAAAKGLERGFLASSAAAPTPAPAPAPPTPTPSGREATAVASPAPPPAAATVPAAASSAKVAAPKAPAVPLDEELAIDTPDEFQCVITKEMFREPVITSDGHTYERSAIRQWLESHDTSPRTGNVLPDRVLRPNHVLRSQIVEFRERHGLAALPVWEVRFSSLPSY